MQTALTITRIDGFDQALPDLTRRGSFMDPELSPAIQDGIRRVVGAPLGAREVVERIVGDIRVDGDKALRRYTEAFDGDIRDSFEVPRAEWQAARKAIDSDLLAALEL